MLLITACHLYLKAFICDSCLQEFFQVINFYFTRTTEHQPTCTGNLHSSTKRFAMTPAASHFDTYMYLSATWEKMPRYSRVLARQMASLFIIFYHLHSKFIHWIIKLLFCMKFLSCCRFPNIRIDMGVMPRFLVSTKHLCVWVQLPWNFNFMERNSKL